jgi:hypothetical protein
VCDYSLHDVVSRPARVGDKLITSLFPGTYTRGFAAVGEPTIAVCLLPGTELAFENDVNVRWNQALSFFRRKESLGKLVRFRQINIDNPNTHHDAVEFPSGKLVLLTTLCDGQRATVLQLPAALRLAERTHSVPTEAEAESRVIDLAPTDGDSWTLISWIGM